MLEYNNIFSLGATLLIGLGFGIILQKGRFCFTSALRDFIAFKDTRVLNGVTIGILTMMLGTSIAYVLGVSSSNFCKNVIQPTSNELKDHQNFLKRSLKKNYY